MAKKPGKSKSQTAAAKTGRSANGKSGTTKPAISFAEPAVAPKISLALAADKSVVKMSVIAGQTTARVAMTAEQLDGILASLAKYREKMTPPIGLELTAGRQFSGVVDPRYRIASDPKTATTTLVVRHPGFGWIGYLFPQHEAVKLRSHFQRPAPATQ